MIQNKPTAPAVGFSGSRRLSAIYRPRVVAVVAAILADGREVLVGDANGADAFVRSAAPSAEVFKVESKNQFKSKGDFVARSIRLVRAVAAGSTGSGFIVFPDKPCPPGLSPSPIAGECFCGTGSGSWASAALAAGLGLSVVVFPCGFSALPAWAEWQPAGSGIWSGGFLLR